MDVIRGKKALVTGAASGIGRAIALALAREGADLYLLDIDAERLAATTREAAALGVAARGEVCDLTQPAAIAQALVALSAVWERVDILVNNAGVAYYGPTDKMSAGEWDRILGVNLLAPVQLIRALLPGMLAGEGAHILNVCSLFGLVSSGKMAAYQASKFGLVGLSLSLRVEYGRSNRIGVTALCPGFVRTPLIDGYATGSADQKRHQLPGFILADPDKVAARAVHAIRKNRGLVVLTPLARAWWSVARLSPGLVDWIGREGWRRWRRKKKR
jgi:3-oxoacyl-[acyl-carrier protein] reductase